MSQPKKKRKKRVVKKTPAVKKPVANKFKNKRGSKGKRRGPKKAIGWIDLKSVAIVLKGLSTPVMLKVMISIMETLPQRTKNNFAKKIGAITPLTAEQKKLLNVAGKAKKLFTLQTPKG